MFLRMKLGTLLCLICVLLAFQKSNSARILGVFFFPSHSHQTMFQAIYKELSLRGHEVTVYTPLPLNDPSLTNLTEYDVSFSKEVLQNYDDPDFKDLASMTKFFEDIAEAQLSHKFYKDLIANKNNQSFDVFLVEYLWAPFYNIKDIYKVPMIGISSLMEHSEYASRPVGIVNHPAVDADVLLPFIHPSNFLERLKAWITNMFMTTWVYTMSTSEQTKRHFGPNVRSHLEVRYDFSLLIGNSNLAIKSVKPTSPMYVPVSGLHIRPVKPLPKDLEEQIVSCERDVIYVSFGNTIQYSILSNSTLNTLTNVFGSLPYTVLWKFERDLLPPKLPENILVQMWFPQQDILGHNRTKLFITQGGIQSIDESVAHHVPMVVIPFHFDQPQNAKKVEELGIAEIVNAKDISFKKLHSTIHKVLSNSSYRHRAAELAKIMFDEPMPSLDKAVWWIEYVIRHKGARHLRYRGTDLPFFQYYLVDIYLFLLSVGALTLVCLWICMRFTYKQLSLIVKNPTNRKEKLN